VTVAWFVPRRRMFVSEPRRATDGAMIDAVATLWALRSPRERSRSTPPLETTELSSQRVERDRPANDRALGRTASRFGLPGRRRLIADGSAHRITSDPSLTLSL
jgi:hypothetical protein